MEINAGQADVWGVCVVAAVNGGVGGMLSVGLGAGEEAARVVEAEKLLNC